MQFSGIDITQILVTLISTAGAILCAVVGKKAEDAKHRRDAEKRRADKPPMPLSKWAVGMWICIVVAVMNSGLLGWRWLRPGPTTDVTITYPINQARVDQTETVRGTSQGLSAEQVIWVVVFVQEVGRYYPQNRPADMEAGDNWSSIVYIGIPADTGKRFDILAVVANEEAQDAFTVYLADARDRSDWPGLESLPAGAVIYDRITVTRR
jgi:hypothetical protein